MSATQKAQVFHSFGLDQLTIEERPLQKPGPGQLLLRMKAASLNYRDLLMVAGNYNPRLKMPLVPCSDGVGVVEEAGEGCARKPGTRVSPIFARTWHDGPPFREMLKRTHGGPLDGTLQQFMVVPEEDVVHVPEHLGDEEAAALPCAGLTAWSSLVERGPVRPGEKLLILGTGGVSIFALQFGRILGAEIIVTSGSDAKLQKAAELGAHHLINYRTNPNWDREVFKLTGGQGVDHIVEVGGVGTLEKSIRSVRPGGSIYLIGVLAGKEAPLDLTPVLMQDIRIQGVVVGSRRAFQNMNRAVDVHEIHPVVDRVFSFEESVQAFEYLKSGSHFGKICIRIQD
ncbi:MAG: NAD(P)-dependent alcohol dehydrogenase [Leptospiraceae bacterium]|nr:NAD(P)-dependent alcohol dehydrogenase [Leptospiraceae bacterium]